MKIHMPDPYFLEQRGFHFAACGCIGNPQAFTTDTEAVTCKHCLRRIEACRKIREELPKSERVVMGKEEVRG